MTNKIRTELSEFASISFTTRYKTGELRSALQKHADTLREWTKVNTGGVWVDAEPMREDRTKHPLEEVFAGVSGAIPNAEARRLMPVGLVDSAFRNCVGNAVTQPAPLWGLPPLHWARVSVIWAAARLIKQSCYKTIEDVLAAAVLQATKGKGQRHGGDATPFLEQPWVKLYRTHGLGFLLGQADKKYHEALSKPDTESFEREILGAIVYLGMALLALEGRV